MAPPVNVVIGRFDGDRIVLSVRGRVRFGGAGLPDGDWLATTIHARLGGHASLVSAEFRAAELAQFRAALEGMSEGKEDEARLDSSRYWLYLTCHESGHGHVSVSGELCDRPGVGNVLHFWFNVSVTSLPSIIDALREVEAAEAAKPGRRSAEKPGGEGGGFDLATQRPRGRATR